MIEDNDFFICKAFKEIITSGDELENKLGNKARFAIANYLLEIPPEEYENPSAIANHISAFCQRSGNESLYNWLLEIYNRLDETGIEKILKQNRDPGEQAEKDPQMSNILIYNEARETSRYIKRWLKKERDNNNQSTRNDSNSN